MHSTHVFYKSSNCSQSDHSPHSHKNKNNKKKHLYIYLRESRRSATVKPIEGLKRSQQTQCIVNTPPCTQLRQPHHKHEMEHHW